MIGVLAIIVWMLITMETTSLLLKALKLFRVPHEVEMNGLDLAKHGEAAYPLVAYGHSWGDDKVAKEAVRKLCMARG